MEWSTGSPQEKLATLEQKARVALPREYKCFLLAASPRATFKRSGKEWRLATLDGMLAPVTVARFTQPYAFQMPTYVSLLNIDEETNLNLDEDQQFPVRRLRTCLCIGEETGNLLFLDPRDGFSVWGFLPHGPYVEKHADGILSWLLQCEIRS